MSAPPDIDLPPSAPAPAADAAPLAEVAPDSPRPLVRRRLWIALALSIIAHALTSLWPEPDDSPTPPPSPPLHAELTRIPPPPKIEVPAPSAAPDPSAAPTRADPPAARRPRPAARAAARPRRDAPAPRAVVPNPPPVTALAAPEPPAEPVVPSAAPDGVASDGVAADGEGTDGEGTDGTPAAEPPAPANGGSPAASPAPVPSPGESLPPIVELVYSAFWGSRGFIIGTVGYRFEHDGRHYSIETVGTAYGLVALLFPGQLRVESRGALTAAGLVPEELRVARGGADRQEVARFDRTAGMLTLHGRPPQAMEGPTYDLLTFWLQFYFAPPAGDEVRFRVATTRHVREYRLRRAGSESVTTPLGTVDTEVWERVVEDRNDPGATIWLAPLWHYLPVKVRLSGRRGAVEQLLIGVRTGLDVPESVSSRERLSLPLDQEGRDIQEPIPAEQRHTP